MSHEEMFVVPLTSIKNNRVQFLPTRNPNHNLRHEAFCLAPSIRASMSVEASLLSPLIISVLFLLLFLFQLLRIEAGVEEALSFSARRTATLSTVAESGPVLLAESELFFHRALKETLPSEQYIYHGYKGVSLLGSCFRNEYVKLCASYKVKVPLLGKIGLTIPVKQTCCSRLWSGEAVSDQEYVYVTEHGSVYHRTGECESVKVRPKGVLLEEIGAKRNQDGSKYSACSYCAEENTSPRWVYITDYGTAYHYDLQCKSIKKTMKRIPLQEIGSRRRCAVCWKE